MTQSEVHQAAYDMIYLISCILNKKEPDQKYLNKMEMDNIYKISCLHNLTAITYKSISLFGNQKNLEDNIRKKWKEKTEKAVRKNILLDIEREDLFNFCEKNKIWYLPLKGVILKNYYPQDGMRQMADNDILFDRTYQREIYHWFTYRGYEAKYEVGNHDCYYKEPIYNFEMHISLFGNTHNPIWVEYYKDIEKRLCRDNVKKYLYHFSREDFYIYIMCHAYKHYDASGTGLRTLLDFYMYLKKEESNLDWIYIKNETKKLEIEEFEEKSRILCKKLFGNEENLQARLTEEEKRLLDRFVLSGTYGTREQRIRKQLTDIDPDEQSISWKTKCIYWKQRVFPDEMQMEQWTKMYSPFLHKHHCYGMITKIWRIVYVIFKRNSVIWDEWKLVSKSK